ncbi:hypothetical protein OROGR_032193 [Orobanche gracilis]
MKEIQDKQRKETIFVPGDWVLLRLRPYRQQSLSRRTNQKLSRRYFGPFRILKQIGAVAYELELPPLSRLHPVFHVSLLRRFHGDPSQSFTPLPRLATDLLENVPAAATLADEPGFDLPSHVSAAQPPRSMVASSSSERLADDIDGVHVVSEKEGLQGRVTAEAEQGEGVQEKNVLGVSAGLEGEEIRERGLVEVEMSIEGNAMSQGVGIDEIAPSGYSKPKRSTKPPAKLNDYYLS